MVRGVNKAATPPKYVVIAAAIRDRIATDGLGPHALLPSERELGDTHSVSRMTARQALSLLESEGLVYRRPPRGTFVAEPPVTFHIGSFTDEVTRLGRRPAAALLWAEQREPTDAAREAFRAHPGPVHALCRLRLADDEPIAIETTYFPVALTPGLLDLPLDGSLWRMLRDKYGIVPARSKATIRSVVIDNASCARLRIRTASAGVLLTRRSFDQTGRCFEFAQDTYRADRAVFEVEATVSTPK